jgi:CHAT domain-containing protein/tetratricopeptide (TPR) repeat protein
LKKGLRVFLFLFIPLAGTVRYSAPPSRTKSLELPSNGQAPRKASLASILAQCRALFHAGDFQKAGRLAWEGYQDAMQDGQRRFAVQFLNNLGGCRFAQHQYQEALRVYLDARSLAEASGDHAQAGKLDFNISSLYFQLGQLEAAVDSAARALQGISGADRARHLPALLIHLATLRSHQGRPAEARELYAQGIAAADRAGDAEMYALGWNDLGEEYLDVKEFPEAERALLEAYRVRKLNRLRSIESSYRNLGLLRLEQGDVSAASRLLDRAVACSKLPGGLLPAWQVYYARGRARLAQNRLPEALHDLRIAARRARRWRRATPLGDGTRVSAENAIQSVHAALVEAGSKLYFATHRRSLARETFEAAEANRAASLRSLLAEPPGWRRNLPAEYWETLRKLESAELELLRGPSAGAADRVARLQGALVRLESRAGTSADLDMPDLLERTRRRLGPDAAFLAFHLAWPDSYLWAVSREHFALYRLPPATEINPLVGRFQQALREGSANAAADGHRLFRTLFGSLDPVFRRKAHWLLAPDAQLYELPFAALVVETNPNGPVFLAERHSVQTTSGAGMLVSAGAANPLAGPFLGVADPVYNAADPRRERPAHPVRGPRIVSLLAAFAASAAPDRPAWDLHLARLAGSAREVEGCAAAWGGPQPPLLLEGAAASRGLLQKALRSHPAVLHFATHVLHPGPGFRSGLIVLSLADSGQHEVLGPAEIATWHLQGAVVSLSGCSSGSAEALPATGLMGLTRAWQAAGARAVVASRWPSPDDTGALFLSFYRHLREAPGTGPAAALQSAQIDMLRSHTWRSNPAYWGAYFVTGNQP